MKPTVYLETTVIGYLATRVSGLLRVAANQQTTRDWWDNHRQRFDLFVSRFVIDECAAGDPVAAQERLVYLEGIPLLQQSEDVNAVAEALRVGVPLPQKAGIDAFHRCRSQRYTIPVDMELQPHRQSVVAAAN